MDDGKEDNRKETQEGCLSGLIISFPELLEVQENLLSVSKRLFRHAEAAFSGLGLDFTVKYHVLHTQAGKDRLKNSAAVFQLILIYQGGPRRGGCTHERREPADNGQCHTPGQGKMVKKSVISGLLAVSVLLGLTACTNQGADPAPGPAPEGPAAPVVENPPAPEETAPAEPAPASGSKVLVACFSATGNTMPLAEYAADILGADLYEIVPQEPYTEEDLAYYTDCRADREQEDAAARPAISGGVEHMEQYDTVLLGYPIWHGRPPRIICTFLESYDWAGKTVIPFCTSGSSPYSDSGIRELVDGGTAWVTGRRFAAGTDRETIADWLGTLELESSSSAEDNTLYLTVNGHTLTAALEENSSAQALRELLADGPLTIDMSDYGGMEKVGPLGADLPRNDEQITAGPGDLILYQGNRLVLYYDRNDWSLTRLGKVNDVSEQELRDILGTGGVSVTLALAE